jgi:steroid delta-isomerase-like uncharacterized protein
MLDAKDVARRSNDAFNAKDWTALAQLLCDHVEYLTPGNAVYRGVDGVRDFAANWWAAFPDVRASVHRVTGEGSTVIQEGTYTGTHQGVFRTPTGTIPPMGRRVKGTYVAVLTVEQGRLARHHLVFDRLELLEQLGLVPPAPGVAAQPRLARHISAS